MSIVKRLAGALARQALWRTGTAARHLRAVSGRWVMMVHGVGDGEISRDAFAVELAWLAAHFRIVRLQAMIDDLAAERAPAAGGEVAITFDDGLRNQALHAYPVLRELGIPATIFVCPGLIDSGAWLWNHEARARLQRLAQEQRGALAERAGGSPHDSVRTMVERWKQLPASARRELQDELRRVTPDFEPTASERGSCDLMSWDEIAALDPELITIGSHTVSHPILPGLDDAELEFEIRASREMLERRLARPVELFCFPNGASDARAQRIVARTYRGAVTTRKGAVPVKVDPMAIPRVAMEASCSRLAWRMMRLAT